jgi:hypothetical protein
VSKLPATDMMHASIKAVVKDLTSKPEKNLSAIFITIASTISLTKKDSSQRVTKFSGNLNKAPMVAFKMPITSATNTAVPKFFILTEGIILATNSRMAALINNCNIQFIPVFCDLSLLNVVLIKQTTRLLNYSISECLNCQFVKSSHAGGYLSTSSAA